MKETSSSKFDKKKSKTKKIVKKIFQGLLIFSGLVLIGGVGVFIYGYHKYGDKVEATIKHGYEVSANIDISDFNNRQPTQFFDKDGILIREFKVNEYNYEKISNMNPYIPKAVVSIEDERFYSHEGIDYQGIARAVWIALKSKGKTIQGGSTITQQLARNVYLTLDRNMFRKVEEMVIAKKIEDTFSKEEIIEFYVNNINYGYGCYSIETASLYYFQKPSKELTLGEVALLTGIPNNPTMYNPVENPDNAIKKRNTILEKMLELGCINQAEYQKAINEEIKLNIKPNIQPKELDYAMSYAVHNATLALMEKDGFVLRYSFKDSNERSNYFDNYSDIYAEKEKELLSGGYKIKTSIDTEKQKKLQTIVDEQLSKYESKNGETGLYKKQSAVVTIDNKTGEVVAIVGGRGQEGNTFNRAFLGARQPGSTIKPLIAYTPSFERGYIPSSRYNDAKIAKGPKNYDYIYRGLVSLRFATEISINTIPFRLVDEMDTSTALKYLTNMEFKYIMPQDTSPVVAVGGFTRGITPVELASAYSTLSRNGQFIRPTNVKEITLQSTKEVVYENNYSSIKIYDSGASYLMTDVLKGVINKSYGTGNNSKLRNYPYQAGKTGTTDGAKDVWYAGYTPIYTTVAWVGNDIPAPQNMLESEEPGYIWRRFMEYLHEGKDKVDFAKPNTILEKNGILMNSLYIQIQQDKVRKDNERNRIEEENREQLKRLDREDYRIKYGLSKEDEDAYERIAEGAIKSLEAVNLTEKSQYSMIDKLVEKALSSIVNVKHQEAYFKFRNRIDAKIYQLNRIRISLDTIVEVVPEEPKESSKDAEVEQDKKDAEVKQDKKDDKNTEEVIEQPPIENPSTTTPETPEVDKNLDEIE